jgi:hypothetical protein
MILNSTLPVALSYEEIVKCEGIKNPYAVIVSNATLDFHPYYIIEYVLNVERKDPTEKKHTIQARGKHIVNAFNGDLISAESRSRLKKLLSNFSSIIGNNNEENLEAPNNEEKKQTIIDLKEKEPIRDYAIENTGDYTVGKIRVNVSSKEAEKTVLEKIVADNVTKVYYKIKKAGHKVEEREMTITPRRPDISTKTFLTHVPKWRITLRAAGITYKRMALAASKVVLVDEIAFCSAKHFSLGRIWNNRRRTYAVCEICGGAFCDDHIFPIHNTYYCEDHRPNNDSKIA